MSAKRSDDNKNLAWLISAAKRIVKDIFNKPNDVYFTMKNFKSKLY